MASPLPVGDLLCIPVELVVFARFATFLGEGAERLLPLASYSGLWDHACAIPRL